VASTNISIRTSVEVKEAAEKLFDDLGLNLSSAVNVFLRQAIRVGGLPFDVKVSSPSEITAEAIAEGRRLMKDSSAKGFHSIEELRAELDV